jgi:hypothetical protein
MLREMHTQFWSKNLQGNKKLQHLITDNNSVKIGLKEMEWEVFDFIVLLRMGKSDVTFEGGNKDLGCVKCAKCVSFLARILHHGVRDVLRKNDQQDVSPTPVTYDRGGLYLVSTRVWTV